MNDLEAPYAHGNLKFEIVRKPYTVLPRPGNSFHRMKDVKCANGGVQTLKCKDIRLNPPKPLQFTAVS
jgi:hypothetical protein